MTNQLQIGPYAVAENDAMAYFLLIQYSDMWFEQCPGIDAHRARVRTFAAAATDFYQTVSASGATAEEEIQYHAYEIGKTHFGTDKSELRDWFRMFYFALLRKPDGSRIGMLANILGLDGMYYRIAQNINTAVH